MWTIIIIALYFAPTIAAYSAKKKNASAIMLLNILLGWTVVGWIIAAIWASCKD